MNATEIIAYTYNSELLCAEHGKALDNGEDDGAYPIFCGNTEFNAVECCSNGANAHMFCMTCGTDLDFTKGAQDGDANGHFSRCWNCHTESVYVDGSGRERAGSDGRWADALSTHTVQVYGPTITYQTGIDGYTTVTAVADTASPVMHRLKAYVVFLESDPSSGTLLMLANDWEDAYSEGTDYFEDLTGEDFDREDLQCCEVLTDQVWFSSKP